MFKKSLLVGVLMGMMGLNLIAEEVTLPPMEGPVDKCDKLFDACIEKCGEGDDESCMDKCQDEAEKCDMVNAPTN